MKEKTAAVENFLASLDTSMPLIMHYKNVLQDAKAYKWKSSVVRQIMQGIEKAYQKKEAEGDR